MTALTPTQRKQAERDRMRDAGFVLRQFWIHPKDWERASVYLDRLKMRRAKA